MYESDDVPPQEAMGENTLSRLFWAQWDLIKKRRVKLRVKVLGIQLRPSVRLEALEPVIVKLLGPRTLG